MLKRLLLNSNIASSFKRYLPRTANFAKIENHKSTWNFRQIKACSTTSADKLYSTGDPSKDDRLKVLQLKVTNVVCLEFN